MSDIPRHVLAPQEPTVFPGTLPEREGRPFVPLNAPDSRPESLSDKDVPGTATPSSRSGSISNLKPGIPPLATRTQPYDTKYGPVTDAFYHYFGIKRRRIEDLDDIATQESVFDGDQADFFQPRDDWENIGSFDPSFRWTWREEKAAVRKVDLKVFSWVLVMFLSLNIQRSNITNATADNFLEDLGLSQADYNLGVTLARVAFLAAELPSQLISKRLGPDLWIPMQIVAYSVIGAAQFGLGGRSSFLATRFLLSMFQGGFIPDAILYLSYWFNKYDLPVRLAFFFTMNYLGELITNFLAVGLLSMRGILGYEGWRWLFLIEGLLTLVIGIASFFLMPTSPGATKAPWRPNGYLNEKEAKIIVNRTIRDDPRKGEMHNRQPLTFKFIWKSLTDYHLWPLYLISLTFNLPTFPLKNYLQIQYRRLGFSTVLANVLAVPNTILSIITIIAITILSEAVNNRSFVCAIQNIALTLSQWYLPNIVVLTAMTTISPWQYFGIATAFLGGPWVHAIQVAWCSRNAGSVRTRTVSAALYNMAIQTSAIIGANVYQASDAPRYYTANKALIAVVVFNIVILYPGTWLFYRHVNKKREAVWGKMSNAERVEYLRTTKDEGNKRLDFRFAF